MSKKSIMITGVSTGIGLGTLSYFVKNGFHVYGSVRNSKDASRLKKIYKCYLWYCYRLFLSMVKIL